MKFEKDYKIEKWTKWNSFLNDSIGDFYNSFSIYPNILEANGHTHSQIDFLTTTSEYFWKYLLQSAKLCLEHRLL